MIASIRGTIAQMTTDLVVVETAVGIGYAVLVPTRMLEAIKVGESEIFHVYHHITDKSQTLFGFQTLDEKDFFELLLKVKGVGPKTALSVFHRAQLSQIQEAIASGEAAMFKSVTGVGGKTAERIINELKDKLLKDTRYKFQETKGQAEVVEAMQALGYKPAEVMPWLKDVAVEMSVEEKVRAVLGKMGERG